jgi:hypothetical protein
MPLRLRAARGRQLSSPAGLAATVPELSNEAEQQAVRKIHSVPQKNDQRMEDSPPWSSVAVYVGFLVQ